MERQKSAEETREYYAKMEFLARVPLMKRLPKSDHPLVANACTLKEFKQGSDIIRQGEPGHEFFVIRSGEASVRIADESGECKTIATLRTGDYFGESALLRDEERAATITAETDLSAFSITRERFQDLGLHESLQFANRRAVGGGVRKPTHAKPPTPKTPDEVRLITNALWDNENFRTITTLDDDRVKSMVGLMWKEEVTTGQKIITEGDLNADYFYVVQEGKFEVYVSDENNGREEVGAVSAGGSFGELALLYFVPRAATVRAITDAVVWVLDRQNFKGILLKVSDHKQSAYAKYLDGVQILQSLLSEERRQLARALVEMHFVQDEVIIQQGEPGSTFYILYDGEVSITKDGDHVSTLSACLSRGTAQYFGEGALLDSETRGATVRVTSPSARTLVLDRDAFDYILGPLRDLIERNRLGGQAPPAAAPRSSFWAPSPPEINREKLLRKDLMRVGILGCGGFGVVELYEHRVTRSTYALKGLSKGYILKTGMQDSVMNEKKILMMTDSPFIIRLFETYNTRQMLYFLLEPALGGELYATYHKKSLHGSAAHCKYYTAGTVCAFEHMHERRIIYRDLKPENLLLNHKGHLKLTDMGLAKFVIGKTYTTCGTPDYFAPEVIASTGHTNAVDWWALGVLIFELMSGHPPFESPAPIQIYKKVTAGIGKIPFPAPCQGQVGDLIKQLMKADPSERLPMRRGGPRNIRAHKWFGGFDWKGMEGGTAPVPYHPVVLTKKDLANFSVSRADMPRIIDYRDPGTGWDKDFATA